MKKPKQTPKTKTKEEAYLEKMTPNEKLRVSDGFGGIREDYLPDPYPRLSDVEIGMGDYIRPKKQGYDTSGGLPIKNKNK